ncbi:hypothetical protein [Streptomyces sp. NPDC059142]|uniref:hypothetical protein n=1 Tax=Streptomyces sp. NPDC059142 TaxID=3346739 RepID=UPI00368BA2C8
MSRDDPAKVITEPGTFSLVSCTVDTANGDCGAHTGCFTPVFGADRTGPGSGAAAAPYDRSTPMDARLREGGDTACGSATRS